MKLTISSRAEKQLKKLPKISKAVVVDRIKELVIELPTNVEKLKGYKNYYRLRVGIYRVVFLQLKEEIEVVIIGHRKEVYLLLRKLLG